MCFLKIENEKQRKDNIMGPSPKVPRKFFVLKGWLQTYIQTLQPYKQDMI